jgi:cytochrome c-type biogenesis protein CcmH
MKLAALLLLLATLVAATSHAAGPAADVAADPALEVRVQKLSAELRCLVCQNQSLADSHADLALDLKKQVREQLAAGKSESEVIAYMTQRYGDFVLYRPPLKGSTMLLWVGPALLVAGGALLLARTLSRRREEPPPSDDDAALRARAAALLGEAAKAP